MSSETTKNSLSTTRCFKISWIQKIEIYKTQARFYVIGSNLAENKFRILKIDRTEPYDLAVLDDCIDYNKYQITGILQSLNSAHGGSLIGKTGRKLLPSYTGFGIVGFVRLMEGYYLILITKRTMVADIGGNLVYKIEDTTMVYLPNNQVKIAHTDEWRYLKAFQTVDLSSNFYYSHSYDLTNTLQHNMLMLNDEQTENSDILHLQPNEIRIDSDDSTGESWVNLTENELRDMKITDEQCRKDLSAVKRKRVAVNTSPCARYLWNKYLLEPMDFGCVSPLWGIQIIHGHIEQACVNVYGKLIYITLVARRSSRFAGTRFMKRGCNVTNAGFLPLGVYDTYQITPCKIDIIEGDVANEVETEQMVHCACATSLRHTQMTSYVQHRGSVPVQWLQDITASVVPAKPPIVLSVDNPFYQTTGKHFQAMMKRYGSPLMVLNLVRKKEKRHRESVLGQEFKQALEYLNQFLPTEHRIEYFALDMAHQSRLPNSNLLARLADIAERSLQSTGIFQSKPALFKKTLDKDLRWRQLGGAHVRGFRIQTGVLRTNCVDCLDRTNSAQFVAGKSALAYQLFSLGVLPQPTVNFDTDVTRLYEEMFDQHGDIVALQYGGSQLVHTIQTYRRTVAPWTSHSRDIVTTLSRYYSNTFSDADKQSAINLFLGLYRPSTAPDPLWDLDTDHYLHNDDMQVLTSFALHDYVRWCFPKLIEILPLPYDTVTELNERRESREEGICHVTRTPAVNHCDDCCDWFDDFHRTNELTVFDDSLALQLANTLNRCISYGYSDPSPFAIRSENWQHWNRQQRLQSDSTASQSSNDVISSNESSDSDDNNLQAKPSSYDVTTENDTSPPWFKKPTLEDFSPQKVYGIDLDHATSAQDSRTFHEHLSYQVLLDDETSSGYNSDLESSIPSPIVDKQSLAMYRDSVAHNYKVDRDFYRDYLLQFSA